MTTTMTKLDRAVVKQIVGKLPIELVNPLLIACNPDCNFLPPDNNSTNKKKLRIHREKLVNAILEGDDVDTFNQAEKLAKSMEVHDEKINPKQKELEKLKEQIKDIREQIKDLDYIKQKDIDEKAQALIEALGEEKSQRLAQYNSDTEKARAELYREKEREKALKACFKALAISVIDKMENKYLEATQELKSLAIEYAEQAYNELEENSDINVNLNTIEGMKLIDTNLEKASEVLVNKAINKSRLGLQFKNNSVTSSLTTKAVKSKPQTVGVSV